MSSEDLKQLKWCPLLNNYCNTNCAWYCESSEMCSMKTLAESSMIISVQNMKE